ncbi:1-acyl-sn-glycerol-3-phosphate acyltransferase [Altericroceibacterium endophyticum]|uniref:1-acyl-sn-glycerol-3-phosphate acyltransferase n=1 Tax=Altericroceibacterium endophyticum TaxID=1808508 RepID=UPI0013706740
MIIRLALLGLWLGFCLIPHGIFSLFGAGRKTARLFLSGLGYISGLRLRVVGQAEPQALLLSNHVTWMDIPALAHVCGASFIAHDGLSGHPFMRWLCEQNDTIFISRSQRLNVRSQIDAISHVIGTRCLALFPEGTTSLGDDVAPFKSSLLSAAEQLPETHAIQPVALCYDNAPEIAWVGDNPGPADFFRIFARLRPVRLTVRFLSPIPHSDRKTMARHAECQIRNAIRF